MSWYEILNLPDISWCLAATMELVCSFNLKNLNWHRHYLKRRCGTQTILKDLGENSEILKTPQPKDPITQSTVISWYYETVTVHCKTITCRETSCNASCLPQICLPFKAISKSYFRLLPHHKGAPQWAALLDWRGRVLTWCPFWREPASLWSRARLMSQWPLKWKWLVSSHW